MSLEVVMDDMLELKVQVKDIEYEDNLKGIINLDYLIGTIWINNIEVKGDLYCSIEDMLYKSDLFNDRVKSKVQYEALDRAIAYWESIQDRDR
jgi:hypothetical protein